MPLSATAVQHAKGREKPYKLTDSAGLYLLVNTDGRRYWRFNYRFGGKQKTLAFGVFPDVGLADAREKRDAARELIAAGKDPTAEMKRVGYKPDLKKRGSMRTVFDGRYKFSRYFAPVDRNRPATIDDLYKANDVELFDLQTDPEETVNLAADREKHKDLISAMSTKLEAAIKAEIGVDDGREMPEIPKFTWYMDSADL